MSQQKPLPIILCGRRTEIGSLVAKSLLPEYEVIHFVTSAEAGIVEIPPLLAGKQPPPPGQSNDVGTRNYAGVPIAVASGGGLTDEDYDRIHAPCVAQGSGCKGVPWLRMDIKIPLPEEIAPGQIPEYPVYAAGRLKDRLNQLQKDRLLDGDAVYFF